MDAVLTAESREALINAKRIIVRRIESGWYGAWAIQFDESSRQLDEVTMHGVSPLVWTSEWRAVDDLTAEFPGVDVAFQAIPFDIETSLDAPDLTRILHDLARAAVWIAYKRRGVTPDAAQMDALATRLEPYAWCAFDGVFLRALDQLDAPD